MNNTSASKSTQQDGIDLYHLPRPELQFDTDGVPSSSNFDDVYFSRDNGLAETEYIFLHHNNLQQRWQALDSDSRGDFVIAETGFGTGLNFLATCKLWLEIAPSNWRLHFISTELYPLQRDELVKALGFWPTLQTCADELLAHYPPCLRGVHTLSLFDGRIRLQLCLGDAAESFASLLTPSQGLVDAWYLDGFSPAKNPGMWHDALFQQIGRLSKSGATVTTFTVAGIVKNGLRSAGFHIEKVAGHGRKRQMLRGVFSAEPQSRSDPLPVWANLSLSQQTAARHIVVIGGGLAGCTTANALAKRGYRVTVVERDNAIANGASGNQQGILYNTLSPTPNKNNLFALFAFLFSRNFYQHLLNHALQPGNFCGHLQLLRSDADLNKAEKLKPLLAEHAELCRYVTADEASQIAGVPVHYPALFFPQTGWLSPVHICRTLLDQPNIEVKLNTAALKLERINETWHILTNDKNLITQADIVVIANAADAKCFSQTDWLPIKAIRGQTTTLKANAASRQLRTAICHDGYIAPADADQHCIGATFNLNDYDTAVRDSDNRQNIESLQQALPDLFGDIDKAVANTVSGRTSFRTTTPDYLPICGQAPVYQDFLRDYRVLRFDARSEIDTPGSYWPGLYINTGHGARGLSYTPFCAEWLASLIDDSARPMSAGLALSLLPARFIIKGLMRNTL